MTWGFVQVSQATHKTYYRLTSLWVPVAPHTSPRLHSLSRRCWRMMCCVCSSSTADLDWTEDSRLNCPANSHLSSSASFLSPPPPPPLLHLHAPHLVLQLFCPGCSVFLRSTRGHCLSWAKSHWGVWYVVVISPESWDCFLILPVNLCCCLIGCCVWGARFGELL